ncbi:MAG: hypothetical protein GX130_13820 [Candidatus Hydrogenedens sp.]|jgi:hypothetical protein|nr:hypothetical protein [Candidatus Hydrogenedens sp.]
MVKTVCYVCGKEKLSRNEKGLSKKLVDEKGNLCYCLDCLAEYLEVDREFLIDKIEEFKDQGCDSF